MTNRDAREQEHYAPPRLTPAPGKDPRGRRGNQNDGAWDNRAETPVRRI